MLSFPVYILIDCSESMSDEAMQAVKSGLRMMHSALRKDPYMLESCYISIITFGSDVQQIVPLTELSQFQPPHLQAGGGRSLGAALQKVVDCANKEGYKVRGVFRPLVFIMTNGVPTDNPEAGVRAFNNYEWDIVVACAVGYDAESQVPLLQRLTENVATLDSEAIAAFFEWIPSVFHSAVAFSVEGCLNESLSDYLRSPPPGINLVKP